jgi:hypothetical protein
MSERCLGSKMLGYSVEKLGSDASLIQWWYFGTKYGESKSVGNPDSAIQTLTDQNLG